MPTQPVLQPEVPIVCCPQCVKRYPMAIRSMSMPLSGKKSEVELVCTNCGVTLVHQLR